MRRFLALLAAAALLLAACGDSGSGPDPADDPKGALSSALESLGNSDGLTMTLKLQSTEESLLAASEGDLPPDAAAKILDSSITVSSRGQTPEDAQLEMLVDIAGSDGFEMKQVNQEVYVRVDVRGIGETFGAPVEELEAGIAEAQAQPGFEFLTPAVDGQWLHLAGAKEFAEQFGGMQGVPSPGEDLQQKAVEAMRKAVDDSATVTSEGSDDIGDHLVANVDLRAFYGGITDALGTLTQGMPAGQLPPASEVPEADLKLDIWLADGTVKQVSFDLLQLSQLSEDVDIPEGVDELGILLQLDSFDDEVEVPGDAVEVDLQQIFQGLMQGMTGGVSGSSSEAVPAPGTDMTELCEQLKEAPDDVKKQFAEQCPDLAP